MSVPSTQALDIVSRGQPASYIIDATKVQPDVASRGGPMHYTGKSGFPWQLRALLVYGLRQWQPTTIGRW